MYQSTLGNTRYRFETLKELMAKATPLRSGDTLAGIAAADETQRAAAMIALSDVPLKTFLNEQIIPYEDDEVTRLIIDSHDKEAFADISHLTVGDFRNWLLNENVTDETIKKVRDGLTPEMVAAVTKIMRNQDLILAASKCEVITKFRSTIGKKGTLTTRLQPNHPTDSRKGIVASVIDGLMYGNGDACIGINPATDNLNTVISLLKILDEIIEKYKIPTQSCVLTHITTTIEAVSKRAPVDLVFQSIGGTEKVNSSFGVNLKILEEGYEAGLSTDRCSKEKNFMYFETGQGSALSANGHHGADQQTIEARAYAVAKKFNPLLVNTVVGFIGPEYLYDGKQIIRAGLEDHFCGKILGIPMGVDICYTNHAEADQDDMDILLTVLGASGCNFIMGIPGSDDIMLNYQSTSFHDALYIRQLLNLKPSEEFEKWLNDMKIFDGKKVPALTESRLKLPEIF